MKRRCVVSAVGVLTVGAANVVLASAPTVAIPADLTPTGLVSEMLEANSAQIIALLSFGVAAGVIIAAYGKIRNMLGGRGRLVEKK